jgi:hypothetical protein
VYQFGGHRDAWKRGSAEVVEAIKTALPDWVDGVLPPPETQRRRLLLRIDKFYCFSYSMDCLNNECTICKSFKEATNIKEIEEMVKRIAEMLGLPPRFKKVDDGVYILHNGTKVVCEMVETATWSDYCVTCSAEL